MGKIQPVIFAAVSLIGLSAARAADAEAEAEVRRLEEKIGRPLVVTLPQSADRLALRAEQGFTVEDLRGKPWDDAPPAPAEEPAAGPYVAAGIQPFRFRRFDAEFHYDGYGQGNRLMYAYAARHGFRRLGAYLIKPGEMSDLPDGTEWVHLSSYGWDGWFQQRKVEPGRWDLLAAAHAAGETLIPPGHFKPVSGYAHIMIDQEYGGLLPVEDLRKQSWYPRDANAAEAAAFEQRYYDGYSLGMAIPGAATRRDGWSRASIYAWQSYRHSWYNLDRRISLDPATPFGRRFLDRIYDAYDILHVDGYADEWSPRNVAFTLIAADRAVAYARQRGREGGKVKPIRLYLSTVILSQPQVGPWLRVQPLPNEDVRAIYALQAFTGVDGVVQWAWSEHADHHRVALAPPPAKDDPWRQAAYQVGLPFTVVDEAGKQEAFARYQFIRILAVDEATGLVRFRRVDPTLPAEQQGEGQAAACAMPRDALAAKLRPTSEPVAAMVEGLALVRALESLLTRGQAVIDVPAEVQHRDRLPIVRRVQLDDLQVVATYDPAAIHGGQARRVDLPAFAGREGLDLTIPADSQVRLFLLRLR